MNSSLDCTATADRSGAALSPQVLVWAKLYDPEGAKVQVSFEMKPLENGTTTIDPSLTTTAPGFATTFYASKFMVAVGLLLQAGALARVF